MSSRTPGQAAYKKWLEDADRVRDRIPRWEDLSITGKSRWEGIAQAGVDAHYELLTTSTDRSSADVR